MTGQRPVSGDRGVLDELAAAATRRSTRRHLADLVADVTHGQGDIVAARARYAAATDTWAELIRVSRPPRTSRTWPVQCWSGLSWRIQDVPVVSNSMPSSVLGSSGLPASCPRQPVTTDRVSRAGSPIPTTPRPWG